MTSEKAIEILDFLSAKYYPNASEKEALELAIKSLEKESNIEKMRVDMRGAEE